MNNNRLEEKRNGGKKKELLYYIKNQAIRDTTIYQNTNAVLTKLVRFPYYYQTNSDLLLQIYIITTFFTLRSAENSTVNISFLTNRNKSIQYPKHLYNTMYLLHCFLFSKII